MLVIYNYNSLVIKFFVYHRYKWEASDLKIKCKYCKYGSNWHLSKIQLKVRQACGIYSKTTFLSYYINYILSSDTQLLVSRMHLLAITCLKYFAEFFSVLVLFSLSKSTEYRPNLSLQKYEVFEITLTQLYNMWHAYVYPLLHSKLSKRLHAVYPVTVTLSS